jgi:phospholipid/cholesterol/gamma-HCH transport system substrate-binding protein
VFGNKYIAFTSPNKPVLPRISSADVIRVSSVTTEFNTLFETVVSIAEKVDPVKLNETLTATVQAIEGSGDRFGQSIIHGNEILADLNPQMPQIRADTESWSTSPACTPTRRQTCGTPWPTRSSPPAP